MLSTATGADEDPRFGTALPSRFEAASNQPVSAPLDGRPNSSSRLAVVLPEETISAQFWRISTVAVATGVLTSSGSSLVSAEEVPLLSLELAYETLTKPAVLQAEDPDSITSSRVSPMEYMLGPDGTF